MEDELRTALHENRSVCRNFLFRMIRQERPFLARRHILQEIETMQNDEAYEHRNDAFLEWMSCAQEAACDQSWVCIALRPEIGRWHYLRCSTQDMEAEEIPVNEYLYFKEQLLKKETDSQFDDWPLEIDLGPFDRDVPKMRQPGSIGMGVRFLNRRLSSELFIKGEEGDKMLLEFLKRHHIADTQLMLNGRIKTVPEFQSALRKAKKKVGRHPPETPWKDLEVEMKTLGFEPGWGCDAARVVDTIELLQDIMEQPDDEALERFLGRLPIIFRIAIFSPHGFLSQSRVLGLPDTGGQVVYILNQVKALEEEMCERARLQGVDIEPKIVVVTRLIPESRGTTCDQPEEHILGTKNCWILRVPFRDASGRVIPQWISRFEIWPYLERFALESKKELMNHFKGYPCFVIGNYSDGNLVASLVAQQLHRPQCNIAHALEKTKYPDSDNYWFDYEKDYHFSCQFVADLISMNYADFIVTSTRQEIRGNEDVVGQYESYRAFTMPRLCRVNYGIDIFDPKFNVISPGADKEVFFPFYEKDRRSQALYDTISEMVFGKEKENESIGTFDNPEKPVAMGMSRLDKVKNVTGLIEWYGRSERFREWANLLIVGGCLDVDESNDREEQEQIKKIYELVGKYKLHGNFRWLRFQPDKNIVGELYRCIADLKGVFVQPALFEAFGLTIIEAMSCGLPTFATCNGGPIEIIKNGRSGFHIDPYDAAKTLEVFESFAERCSGDGDYWKKISDGGIERVEKKYTWKLYAQSILTQARVYSYWRYVTNLERDENRRYLEVLYSLLYRRQANSVKSAGSPV